MEKVKRGAGRGSLHRLVRCWRDNLIRLAKYHQSASSHKCVGHRDRATNQSGTTRRLGELARLGTALSWSARVLYQRTIEIGTTLEPPSANQENTQPTLNRLGLSLCCIMCGWSARCLQRMALPLAGNRPSWSPASLRLSTHTLLALRREGYTETDLETLVRRMPSCGQYRWPCASKTPNETQDQRPLARASVAAGEVWKSSKARTRSGQRFAASPG